jgi:signal transduction histidine kinase
VRRALAVLSVGAFLTLAVDTIGSDGSRVSLALAAVYVLVATVGFNRVSGRRAAYAYVVFQLLLGFAVFVNSPSVGGTLLLLVLVCQSVLVLPVPAVAAIVAVMPFFHAGMEWRDGVREGVGLLAAAGFAAVVTSLLVREQRARTELAETHGRLREYALQAEKLAAAEERNRVARDIHDGLGHALTVVQMQIKAARAVLVADREKTDEVLAKAQEQAEEALREVRRSVAALREPAAAVPLPEALKALAEETSAAGVPTTLDITGTMRQVPEQARETLFRAAQEGLTNVRKHARATRARLALDYSEATVRLVVSDDGVGRTGSGHGYGLLGIEERAAHAGGTAALESAPGKGSTLSVEVPA